MDFDGVIDSLELAIMNGKGIDHKLHLLQDLKDIRKFIQDLILENGSLQMQVSDLSEHLKRLES